MKNKTEFENFSEMTKRLLSVPKSEIDKRHKEWKQERAESQKRKPEKRRKKSEPK